jgi:hypothetical protein
MRLWTFFRSLASYVMELTDFEGQMIHDVQPILRGKARAARQG